MLSHEENELLTRTGPGTPMGSLMRRYWVPALFSHQLEKPDSPPVRVKLMNENLVAFRNTEGRIGLVAEQCPHRTASLFFGRNEECGLRCVYHGWKFDVDGNCVDMPSEPDGTGFAHKIKITAYPCIERGGVVWTYMGPGRAQARISRSRVDAAAGLARPFDTPYSGMQLAAGIGRRFRFKPPDLPASRHRPPAIDLAPEI